MFREECKQFGFFTPKKCGVTHVLMDGGVMYIPDDKLELFYSLCVRSINNFEKIFVVEQKTPIFNFFIDVDYQDSEALSLEQVETVSKLICDKVHALQPENARSIISVAAPKPKGTMIKTGIHINWPSLVVDQENAINLMNQVIKMMSIVYSSRDWSKDIDASVYGSMETKTRGSGFRMPWSHKKGKHSECDGKGCYGCDQTGKIVEGEYLPIFEYTNNETMTQIENQSPNIQILFDTTVRTQSGEITQVLPVEKVEQSYKEEGGFTKVQTKNEVNDQELTACLETFIRKNMEGQENARILKIFKTKMSYYVKTSSKYCENLKRSHSSNHIWFFISKDSTILQKCFCTCHTLEGRHKGVFCKDFNGRKHQLNKKITEILFPNKILTHNKKATICSFLR